MPQQSEQPQAPHPTAHEPARFCWKCGYELRGLTTPRCPECGRGFDSTNPHTYRRRPIRWWHRYVKRLAMGLLTIVVLLAMVWGWFYWGWYDEQRVLVELKIPHDHVASYPMVLDSLRYNELGSAGFVLDRVTSVFLIDGNDITDFSPLAKLSDLRVLSLGGSKLTDISTLAHLTNLTNISLGESNVTDLTPLVALSELRQLTLNGTKVSDIGPLVHFTKLEYLLLKGTSVTNLLPLERLTKLQWLDLERAPITDLSPLSGLKELQALNITRTKVTGLSPLVTLKSLRKLRLPKETIAEAQVEELHRALPDCEITRE